MATRVFLVAVAIVVAIAAPAALAEEIMVGDLPSGGWMYGFDYQQWAAGKHFYVNDTLVFDYSPGEHNVIKVEEKSQLENCQAPDSVQPTTKGFDKYKLEKEGEHYFICGFERHCTDGNMKLTVNVMPKKK